MKTFFDKNTRYFTIMIVLILIFLFSTSSVMADEEKLFPGSVSGTGIHFEIVDSEYLNITLNSSENIKVRMESAPEMVVLETENLNAATSSRLVFSGFLPNTTYYKYQDNYDTYQSFVSDEKGSFSFIQDISQRHLTFIQPRKSTKFITDVNGGDCSNIGVWNDALKTCTLNQDVNESIQIKSDNVTLDGNGHIINGKNTGTGIFIVNGKKGITIKNVTITGFFYGIYLSYYSGLNNISFATLTGNRYGAYLDHSGANVISNNVITKNSNAGLYLFYSTKNIFTDNIIGPENKNGISESSQNYGYTFVTNNIYENNEVFGNLEGGIYIYGGNGDILKNNKIKNNPYYGIKMIESSNSTFLGNVMSGNGEHNFYIAGNKVEDNDIDTSNIVEGKAVYFIKNVANEIYDNLDDMGIFYCTNCQNVTLKNLSLSENKALIFLKNTTNSLIENVASVSKDIKVILDRSNNNTFRNSIFGSAYLSYSDGNQFYGNNFMGTDRTVMQADFSKNNSFNLDLPMGGNFWKKNESSCRDLNNDNVCDDPYVFGGGSDYYPRVNEFEFEASGPSCQENCYSNVMFLPGHQASRLYRKDSDGDEDQLWEPTNHNEDVEQLYMNPVDGTSNDPNIYTSDILDEVYGINNVYKGFMLSMDKFVADGVINKWQAFAYDWRKPLEEVVDNGTKLEDGSVENVLDQIRNSAKESKTGKVTLVGHSNGGLLAKVIVDSLKKSGEEKLVDRIIIIATPQLGTPKAAAGLLHGDGSNFLYGLILDKKTARGFGENMISAYNLLPSKKYFDVVASPIVEFDSDVKSIYDFLSIFGNDIDNFDEFKKFLLGDDGNRTEPDADDTDSPNVLKDNFFSQAEKTHESLDSWQAPVGMEVIQIAGWGLDTIRGIKYDDCDFIFCPDNLNNLDRSLLFTQDGDETVVVPSAVEMDGNAEKYYINMKEYNNNERIIVNSDHASILEIEPLQDFIKNIIQGKKELVDYISTEKPEVKNEDKSLRYRLHSPVALHIYDKEGRHTGLIENKNATSDLKFFEKQIPNSYYMEFGETKYAGSEGSLTQTVVLEGEDLGTFTLEIDEIVGKQDIETTTFSDIPVMQGMKAEILISDNVGEMKIDVDNDGEIDAVLRPGEVIKKEELLGIFGKIISSLDVDKTVKNRLVNKIYNAKKQLEKGHCVSADAMLENVKHQIEILSDINTPEKFRIPKDEAEKLMGIIEKIRAM